ncbi:bestrophin family ion channel, partial [Acinetobacter baumannii]
MIVREQPSIFKVLFSWRGTILPKILPSLGVVMLFPNNHFILNIAIFV